MKNELKNVSTKWVYQSNRLIEASYSLTILEQKLVRLLASMIKSDDADFKEYKFKTKDLIKLLNTSNSRFYRDIDTITDLLMQRVITIKNLSKNEFIKYHWVEVAHYVDGVLTLKINKELKPFYLSLDWYTKYQLRYILHFKSVYSFRLYELCKQYEGIGYRIISIQDLRGMLQIEKSQYPRYSNLKQNVINRVLSEINKTSDLEISFIELKGVRAVESLKFIIKSNNKAKEELAIGAAESNINSSVENIEVVKQIIKEDITDIEAQVILDVSNSNIGKIKEKYEILSYMKNVKSVVATMISAIREDWPMPKGKDKIGTFNNYEQRVYDYNDLEKKLLGQDN